MATNKTSHLKLNDWVGTDAFRREELNENFRALDGKAKEHDDKIAENASGLSSVTSQLAEKTQQIEKTSNAYFEDFKNVYFKDSNDFTVRNFDGTVNSNTWDMNGNSTSPNNETAVQNFLWFKNHSIQDGKISFLVKKNTVTGTQDNIAIMFAGKESYTEAMALMIYAGTSAGTDGNTLKVAYYNNASSPKFAAISTITVTEQSNLFAVGKYRHFQIEIKGDKFNIYLNGKKLSDTDFSINSNLIKHDGKIGINTYSTTTNTDFFVADVAISDKKYTNVPTKLNNVLCVGDSITAGSISTSGNSWVSRLTTELKKGNPNVVVTNAGQGGKNTAQVLSDQVIPNLGNKYEVVTIQCGINDLRTDVQHLDLATTEKNLRTIIKKVKSIGAVPVLCTLTPFPINRDELSGTTTINADSYYQLLETNAMIRRLCATEKVRCCDNYAAMNMNWNLIAQPDWLHPNDAGHEVLFKQMYYTMFGYYPI